MEDSTSRKYQDNNGCSVVVEVSPNFKDVKESKDYESMNNCLGIDNERQALVHHEAEDHSNGNFFFFFLIFFKNNCL